MKKDKISLAIIAALLFLGFVAIARSLSAQEINPMKPDKIRRLSSEERVKLGNAVCELHGEELQLDVVPIQYGLIRFDEAYYKVLQTEFPHSTKYYLGGCVVEEAKKAEVLYCSECRKAESLWQKEHRKK
jgi:hypothetical protein